MPEVQNAIGALFVLLLNSASAIPTGRFFSCYPNGGFRISLIPGASFSCRPGCA